MLKNIVVVGDLHLSKKSPKHDQVVDFLFWLFNSEFNNEENSILFLGDLVEALDSVSELLEVYINLFLNQSKFNHIYILEGNHDQNMDSNFTTAFRPLHNVTLIEKISELSIENINCLCLPYYDNVKTKSVPMTEYYSSLEVTNKFNKQYDYAFHHVEDEQNHYSKKYCDLSWVKTNNWLCGHIHTENITKGGRILGAPIFNSSSEKDKTPYIAKIDISTKQYELIKVPIFLSYLEVDYPEKLSVPKTKYALWTVNNSLNKNETIKYYEKEAKELGIDFNVRRVNNKRIVKETLITGDKKVKESYTETFNRYAKDNKLDSTIHDICIDIISKKESKT